MHLHRCHLSNDEGLLRDAIAEIATALGPVVADLASARARFLVAAELERRDLVPRASVTDQPTAAELLDAILGRLACHAAEPRSTATGAHDVARRVGRSMGVAGATSRSAFRRTRAEVDRDPSPTRPREGTRGLVGGVYRDEIAEPWG